MEYDFGPMKWIVWGGAFWVVSIILFAVFWHRLARKRPVITYEVTDEEVMQEPK